MRLLLHAVTGALSCTLAGCLSDGPDLWRVEVARGPRDDCRPLGPVGTVETSSIDGTRAIDDARNALRRMAAGRGGNLIVVSPMPPTPGVAPPCLGCLLVTAAVYECGADRLASEPAPSTARKATPEAAFYPYPYAIAVPPSAVRRAPAPAAAAADGDMSRDAAESAMATVSGFAAECGALLPPHEAVATPPAPAEAPGVAPGVAPDKAPPAEPVRVKIKVTFATSREATDVEILSGAAPETPLAACVVKAFKHARVPPFTAPAPVAVAKSLVFR